jgi:hypothetical protein
VHAALASVADLESLATAQQHARVALLARIIRLRILVAADAWDDVLKALERIEAALALSYEPASSTPKPPKPSHGQGVPPTGEAKGEGQTGAVKDEFIMFNDAFDAAMATHYLIMAVLYYTHAGLAAEAAPRLSHLHALLDTGALDMFPEGIVEVRLDYMRIKRRSIDI